MGEMDATATVDRRVAVPEGYGEKRCARCGEVLFDDMDVCYGCLYDFGRNREEDLARAGIPEEFALLEGGLEEPEGFGEAHARELPERPDLRVWLRTDSADVILPLPGEGLVLGSDLSCDVVLHSILASPRHLRLVPADGGALAFDMDAGLPATVDGVPMVCAIDGCLRGLLHEGLEVFPGMKCGDVDPRANAANCLTASDKALAVGGGVLEALLHFGCLPDRQA